MNRMFRVLLWCMAILVLVLSISSLPAIAQTAAEPEYIKPDRSELVTNFIPEAADQAVELGSQTVSVQPQGVDLWSKITFQAYWAGNWDVFFADGNGANPVNVSSSPASDFGPRLNRGADKIVFTSNRDGNYEIYAYDAGTHALTRLTYNAAIDASPAWSPDGSWIIFSSDRTGNDEIFIMKPDGTGVMQATFTPTDESGPAWSPDGQFIAWVEYGSSGGTLWVMKADGTNPRVLVDKGAYMGSPVWSPNSLNIYVDYDIDDDNWNEIVSVNAASGSASEAYDANQTFVDAWVGGISPDDGYMLVSEVHYGVQGNYLVIYATYLEKLTHYGSTFSSASRLYSNGVEMNPDWQTADLLPPSSWVLEIPTYTSGTSFDVSWTGMEQGPSGLLSFDIQYRLNQSQTWIQWPGYFDTNQMQATFNMAVLGDTVYFRSRSRDYAGNLEAWPLGLLGDAKTTLFSYLISGNVDDIRGYRLPGVQVDISPAALDRAQTNQNGEFTVHLQALGSHVIGVEAPGYATIAPENVAVTTDLALNFHLLQPDDLIQNGGFEAGNISGWQVGGGITPTATTAEVFSGGYAALISAQVNLPEPVNLSNLPFDSNYPEIVSGPDNDLHVVWLDSNYQGTGLFYVSRPAGGTWTTPAFLGHGRLKDFVVSQDGTVYVFFTNYDGYSQVIYAISKAPGGSWTAPVTLVQCYGDNEIFDFTAAADFSGGMHTLGRCTNTSLAYQSKTPTTGWTAPSDTGLQLHGVILAVTPDGRLHLIERASTVVRYTSWHPSEPGWSPLTNIAQPGGGSETAFKASADGSLHMSWLLGNGYRHVIYTRRTPEGVWQPPVNVGENVWASNEWTVLLSMEVGPVGEVHFMWARQGQVFYKALDPNMNLSEQTVFLGLMPDLAVDSQGGIQVVYEFYPFSQEDGTEVLYRQLVLGGDSTASLSQSVVISPTMQGPTLAFSYYANDLSGFGSSFNILINDTPVYTATQSGQWVRDWLDVSSWAGQAVTVTAIADSGPIPLTIYLDEFALASWSTPVISVVAPGANFIRAGQIITITGENFYPTPQVWIGDTIVSAVEWLDSQTLRVTLPADIAAGKYDVWVSNPGGQKTVLFSSLQIGALTYLPSIAR